MKHAIHQFLEEKFGKRSFGFGELSEALADHIVTPEFSALYAQRTCRPPEVGLGEILSILKLMEKHMFDIAKALGDLGTKIGAGNAGGVTQAQLDDLKKGVDDHFTTLEGKETLDSSDIATLKTGLTNLLKNAGIDTSSGSGTSSGAGASSAAGAAAAKSA